ncbi:hypothetical protein [Paraburkholderia sp. J8-2]|uniref:hypothetical protein n=1 Tax=Paraburkholderia sp. J8-2 TaxID=2805440 RepID=UPI002AB77FB5|nr:hypothetical protein [Paraburkholderia sp. J8-2]
MSYFLRNPSNYTAEKFAEDVAAVLPVALPQYQKHGQMISCARCGIGHRGGSFSIHARGEPDMITDVDIVSVCDVCSMDPALPPLDQWKHVCATSGMFVAEKNWATFATALRWLGADALREKLGWPLVSRLLQADGHLREVCNAVIFFDGSASNLTRESPFVFPWQSDKPVFAGGGSIKVALKAALRWGSFMVIEEHRSGATKQGGRSDDTKK